MANEQNLMPIELVNARKTREERKESASKAGKASGEARRQRKAMKEQMELLLTLPFKQTKQLKFIKELGISKEEIDNQMALIVAMYGKALKGDVQAFNTIREVTQDSQIISKDDRVQIVNDLPGDDEDGEN